MDDPVYMIEDMVVRIITNPSVEIHIDTTMLELPSGSHHPYSRVLTIDEARETGQMLLNGAAEFGEFVVSTSFSSPDSAGPGPILVSHQKAMEYGQRVLDAVESAALLE